MSAPKLLVVEDETIVAMHVEESLKKLGYSVSVAHSGEEAIELAATNVPELAVMDIHLSGHLDGIATAEWLRKRYGVPSVYLTAYTDEETLERARATEPAGYLVKPFRDREVHATIQMALFRASAERRLRTEQTWQWALLEGLRDPVLSIDASQRVRSLNLAAQQMTGWSHQNAVGREVREVLAALGEARAQIESGLEEAFREGTAVQFSPGPATIRGADERPYRVETLGPIVGESGEIRGMLLVFRAAGGPEQAVAGGESPASAPGPHRGPTVQEASPNGVDPVTGLPARPEAELALARALKANQRAFAAAFAVERFKALEGRYGRVAANDVLLFYSLHLAQGLGAGDQLFRWNGPALLVLMERLEPVEMVRREVARVASVRLEKLLHVQMRTALVVISAAANVFPVFESASLPELTGQIEAFLSAHCA